MISSSCAALAYMSSRQRLLVASRLTDVAAARSSHRQHKQLIVAQPGVNSPSMSRSICLWAVDHSAQCKAVLMFFL